MSIKNVLVISSSYRRKGNSELLAQSFYEGVKSKGHHVEMISLADKTIQFCRGCLICQEKKPCPFKDDVQKIIEQMKQSDVIVFATPIYFYEMSGQMKTLLDRTNPLFVDDYQFRDIYLLMTSADADESAMDGAIKGLSGWIECFDQASLKGVVRGVGVDQYGDIHQHDEILKHAYVMGQNIDKEEMK